MQNSNFSRIFIVACLAFWTLSCVPGIVSTGTQDSSESIADLKKRIWRETPPDTGLNLKIVKEFELKKNLPIGRPSSFLLSTDTNLYISDNALGRLFRVPLDLQSIEEFETQLAFPTTIRETKNNLVVYDNNGINVIQKDGKLIDIVKSYLKLDDFDILGESSYVVSLAEPKPEVDANLVAVLDSSGKRVDSLGKIHAFAYPQIEHRAFVRAQDGLIYVCYKFEPLFEIYDLKTKSLLQSFRINASIFPRLIDVKRDQHFVNPEPGKYKIPKFVGGIRITKDNIFVLLHTPNPEIVEFTKDGKEVSRYISSETEAVDYFGFDVRLNKDAKQFFVGVINYSNKSSLVIYEP